MIELGMSRMLNKDYLEILRAHVKVTTISWQVGIHRYIRGKPNGKLIWKSIQNGPTPHPMITDPPPTDSAAVPAPREKLDSEFSEEENKLEMADTQAEIILSQGLPRHIFNNLNQTSTAKEIWVMWETLKKQEQSTSIVDPLAYVAHTTTAPVLPSPSTSSPQPTAQSPNDALMATMTQIANLLSGFQKQFPPTNNQLRDFLHLKTHATESVTDGRLKKKEMLLDAEAEMHSSMSRNAPHLMITAGTDYNKHVSRQSTGMHMNSDRGDEGHQCASLSIGQLSSTCSTNTSVNEVVVTNRIRNCTEFSCRRDTITSLRIQLDWLRRKRESEKDDMMDFKAAYSLTYCITLEKLVPSLLRIPRVKYPLLEPENCALTDEALRKSLSVYFVTGGLEVAFDSIRVTSRNYDMVDLPQGKSSQRVTHAESITRPFVSICQMVKGKESITLHKEENTITEGSPILYNMDLWDPCEQKVSRKDERKPNLHILKYLDLCAILLDDYDDVGKLKEKGRYRTICCQWFDDDEVVPDTYGCSDNYRLLFLMPWHPRMQIGSTFHKRYLRRLSSCLKLLNALVLIKYLYQHCDSDAETTVRSCRSNVFDTIMLLKRFRSIFINFLAISGYSQQPLPHVQKWTQAHRLKNIKCGDIDPIRHYQETARNRRRCGVFLQ
ncbi:hypothetical protein Tco_0639001 [Tanacetum coccineum]